MNITEKQLRMIGVLASTMAILMYVSYIPQIMDNLNGNKTYFLQPLMAAFNCMAWMAYAVCREKKDWPLAVANVPGIILGLIAFATALL